MTTEKILDSYRIKPTAMRILIFEFLKTQNYAVSITEIEAYFHKSERSTLFRTLRTFKEKGLVHQIFDGTGKPKYALKLDSEEPHWHFHCVSCQKTTCLNDLEISNMSVPDQYELYEVNMLLKGLCDTCKC